MPRTSKQFEKIREVKKALIMDTAMELFANEGYHTTSISRIASMASISKGLMYNYFKSKEALLKEIMSLGLKEMVELIDPNHDGILSEDEMVHFISEIFVMLKQNQKYWKLYYAVMLQPKVFELVSEEYFEIFPQFMKMLTDYYTEHGVKNPEKEAMLFGATIDGMAFNYILNPDIFPMDTLVERVKEKFCYLNN